MLVKYFHRGDVFKILKNLDFLRQPHADLLLSVYDTLDWGAWETKVRRCVPEDRQKHLLTYSGPPDPPSLRQAVVTGMAAFHQDAQDVFAQKGLDYPHRTAGLVRDFFLREVG